ncbi:lamin tail domain-containing protein, partial [bacterium]|nr:lamin tail domain-containing protein [bacterium]
MQNVKDALLSIPSWSVTTDLDNLFDEETGIYSHAQERGEEWERAASVELINPDGSEGFQVNAGLRIKGAYSRRPENPKNSFKLYFRDEYGDSELNYPVHGSEGTDTFQKIDLRTAQNWSWSFNGVDRANYIEDELARITQRDLGQPYTRSTWFHLYLNGQYWGIYQTQERHDSNFAASYFGGDPDDYDVIKAENGTAQATDGNLAAWHDLFQQATALSPDNSTPAFASYENYMKAQGLNVDGTRNPNYDVLLDVDNLIDYMAIVIQGGNRDAPIGDYANNASLNNVFFLRDRTGDEGFKFFAHDSEHTMLDVDINRNGPFNHSNFEQARFFNPQTLHQKLMANAEYRLRFADRVQAAFTNGGPLSVEGQIANIDALAAEIDTAIIGESLRWGDAKRSTPQTRQVWLNALDDLRDNYLPARIPVVLQQFRETIAQYKDSNGNYTINVDAPLLPSVDAPEFLIDNQRQHGGQINVGDELSVDAEDLVYYTTDGSDPRLVGGGVSSNATSYVPSSVTSTPIEEGSSWVYNDTGANLGTAWRLPNYNTNTWSTGNGEFGYGDGDEDTIVSFGNDSNNKHVTTYFRKEFNIASGTYTDATLRLLRDDGAVVYLNGVEVYRNNLPGGTIGHTTYATTFADNDGKPYLQVPIDPALLVAGNNTLAVEIHQSSAGSSDISFDAELVVRQQANANSLVLNDTTELNARVLASDGTWSALSQAVFFLNREPASSDNLRLTEINYNPASPDAEYIEFQNISTGANAAEVDLSGVIVTDGPSAPFVFAEGVTLDPQEFGIIVSDVAAFTAAYPNVDPSIILGTFIGGLSNSGEKIRVEAATGEELFDVTYADNQMWGVAADGLGASLELSDPAATPADETGKFYHWESSTVYGGTPGQAIVATPKIVINEVFANSADPNVDYIELVNNGSTAFNIGGWYLSDDVDSLQKYQIPANTIIQPGEYLVFDERAFNPSAASAASLGNTAFGLSSSGDEVWLTYNAGAQTRFVDNVEFSASAEGQSFGLVPGAAGSGVGRLVASATRTPGAGNSDARVSSVVISEVNYH